MTLARNETEANLMLTAFRGLSSLLRIPIFVTDGGSTPLYFCSELENIPGVTLTGPPCSGLTAQIRRSLEAALVDPSPCILYLEPNKSWFVQHRLQEFVLHGRERLSHHGEKFGVLLPARSRASFDTYPPVQRQYEAETNKLLGDLTGYKTDYAYGPRLISKRLVESVMSSKDEFSWGWMSIPIVLASRWGLSIEAIEMDLPCPEEERLESIHDAEYRIRQHQQHADAITWANAYRYSPDRD
jgi:hypothetical protein